MDVERRQVRIGVLGLIGVVMFLALVLVPPIAITDLWSLLVPVLGAICAIGVIARLWVARVVAALALALASAATLYGLVEVLWVNDEPQLDPTWLLAVANAVATSALMAWLSFRGILVLLGRARDGSIVTVRIVGATLLIVAANHLWVAAQLGLSLGSGEGWNIGIASTGTQLIGFPGWELWHALLLVIALLLVAGPRRVLAVAATALLAMVVALAGLVLVAAARTDVHTGVFVVGLVLPLGYLAWWFRDELRATGSLSPRAT